MPKAKTRVAFVLPQSIIAGVHQTWQAIGSECESACAEMGERLTNAAAIETCIDADRMAQYAPAAHKELMALFESVGYAKVERALRKTVRLV